RESAGMLALFQFMWSMNDFIGPLDVALGHLGARFTCIGQIAPESEGLQFIRNGKPVALDFGAAFALVALKTWHLPWQAAVGCALLGGRHPRTVYR
ncbi:hypothetical protein AB0159_27160, partial [Klebsiella pneumoniae]